MEQQLSALIVDDEVSQKEIVPKLVLQTGEFYEILNQLNKREIKYSITDLYNEIGYPVGTRVDVFVPVEPLTRLSLILTDTFCLPPVPQNIYRIF